MHLMSAAREPKHVDKHVGARIRLRRQVLKLSQTALADELGVTFQQIQKYERGANRVGASRLWDISQFLEVPISYFFEGLESVEPKKDPNENLMLRTISSHDGSKFLEALDKIQEGDVRRQLLSLLRTLADDAAQ